VSHTSGRLQPNGANGHGHLAAPLRVGPRATKADRVPPHNIEAEQSCLGSILLDPPKLASVAENVDVGDFYRDAHQIIYRAMLDLQARGTPADSVTLIDELIARGQYQHVGGDEGIKEIAEKVPHAANAMYYALIVYERSLARRAIDAANEILNRAYSNQYTGPELVEGAVQCLQAVEVSKHKHSDAELGMRRASAIEKRPITWLLPDRIPEKDYTLVAGRGKQGKSQFTMALGAKVSIGGEWWDGSGRAPLGHVFYLSAEDDPERIMVPRLEALGANLDNITILEAKRKIAGSDNSKLVSFMDMSDLRHWRDVFSRIENPVLLVVDPLASYVGKGVNDRKNSDVRAILGPFIDLVKEFGMTLLGVTHFGKATDGRNAADKVLDSIAYVNLARSLHYVARDPDTPGRVLFMPGPSNYARADLPSLAFTIVERTVQDSEGGEIKIAVPEFEAGTVEADPEDIVNRPARAKGGSRGPDPSETFKLALWLVQFLDGKGPVYFGEIVDAAGQAALLGSQRWNPAKERQEWTKFTAIYRAADYVAKLPAPNDGWEIVNSKKDPSLLSISGKVRWALRRQDSAF
jgi:hypothetical protein